MAAKYHPQRWALSELQVSALVRLAESWVTLVTGTPMEIALTHRDRAIALLMIYTGVTINEIHTLNNDNYAQDGRGMHCIMVGPTRRMIPLNRETQQAVTRWLTLKRLVFGIMPTNAMFINRRFERIKAASVKQVLTRLRKESGIPFTTFSLRHTFIKRLLDTGCSEDEIALMLSRPSRAVISMYRQFDQDFS